MTTAEFTFVVGVEVEEFDARGGAAAEGADLLSIQMFLRSSLRQKQEKFPKWESLKNKSRKSGNFSTPKNDRQRTSISPATHHKFATKNHVHS